MRGEQPPPAEAIRYERELAGGRSASAETSPPRLDLILLGMGADGHTASLFPGDAALAERAHWVAAARTSGPGVARLTFTLPLLNAARAVLFLVAGADKAGTLATVLGRARAGAASATAPDDTAAAGMAVALPAQRVQPTDGELEWFVDAEAAALL
jgi:6-phosphogluconolactonase